MRDETGNVIFEIGEHYRNRLGWYRVLGINGDTIQVQYVDNGRIDNLTIEAQKTIISNLEREEAPSGIIDRDRPTFFSYVDECNKNYRFGHDLRLYREIINMHRTGSGIDALLDDESFFPLLWKTLDAWNMNQRGAQLTTCDNLRESIKAHRPLLRSLYSHRLCSITEQQIHSGISKRLRDLFSGLKVMESRRKIVGVSKAMHFLLPDLVVPIDGTYTLPYFFGYNRYDASDEAEYDTFEYVLLESHRIIERLNLTDADVDNQNWNTSVPKLIDNAIIGYFRTPQP